MRWSKRCANLLFLPPMQSTYITHFLACQDSNPLFSVTLPSKGPIIDICWSAASDQTLLAITLDGDVFRVTVLSCLLCFPSVPGRNTGVCCGRRVLTACSRIRNRKYPGKILQVLSFSLSITLCPLCCGRVLWRLRVLCEFLLLR
jgi:hypothetical protein